MARHLIPSDATIRAIKPGHPRKRLSDGDGLVPLLFVKGGAHGWRLDYRFGGKRNMLSLGTYPDTTLAAARRKADAARQLLAEGFDPSQKRKAEKAAQQEARIAETREQQGLPPVDSFEAIARVVCGQAGAVGRRAMPRRSLRASKPTCFRGSAAHRSSASRRRRCWSQRMLDDMRMRKLDPKTQASYVRAVRKLARFLERSPDSATVEDLRRFQLHLVDQGISPITINATLTGLKFFFEITLDRPELLARVQPVRVPRTLPVVLSPAEVARLLAAAPNLKHQTALSVAYGAGLRASEVIAR